MHYRYQCEEEPELPTTPLKGEEGKNYLCDNRCDEITSDQNSRGLNGTTIQQRVEKVHNKQDGAQTQSSTLPSDTIAEPLASPCLPQEVKLMQTCFERTVPVTTWSLGR